MKTPKETGSVSQWISELAGSNDSKCLAQQELWNRYFARLAGLARSRMPLDSRRAADEEDVALSALDSFFRRADGGEFPHLADRTGLWPLLARITVFKAIQRVEHERALKRGRARTIRESELQTNTIAEPPTLEDIVGTDPTPELAVQLEEQFHRLMGGIKEEPLRRIAQLKLEGYQNTEIAKELKVGLRTIERKLARIRTMWTEELQVAR